MDVSGALISADGGLAAVSSEPNPLFSSPLFSLQSEPSKQMGLFGSTFSKHGGRSLINGGVEENDDWSRLKMAKGDPMLTATSKSAACLLTRSGSHSLFPADAPQMLSFSSWKSDAMPPLNDEWTSPIFNHPSPFSSSSASPYLMRNAGLVGSGSSNLSFNGVVAGIRGPFTHSQWFELEHQALIYKYIDAKVPIPSSLLVPIKRTFNPSVFPSFTAGSYRTASTLGWGPLHLGFSGNSDPEPGRCRRTDGKKWRCSRDAVADQKYCERHMNRGRHRSRKRVEGHNGHAAKEALPAINSLQSASAVSSGGSSNNLSIARLQSKSLRPSFTDPSYESHHHTNMISNLKLV